MIGYNSIEEIDEDKYLRTLLSEMSDEELDEYSESIDEEVDDEEPI